MLFFPSTPTSQKNRLPHLHFNGVQPWAPFKSSERHFIPSAPPPSEQTSLKHVLLTIIWKRLSVRSFPSAKGGRDDLAAPQLLLGLSLGRQGTLRYKHPRYKHTCEISAEHSQKRCRPARPGAGAGSRGLDYFSIMTLAELPL